MVDLLNGFTTLLQGMVNKVVSIYCMPCLLEIVDLLERTKDWQGAKSIKNIDRGDFLDVQVTWVNKLTGEDETSTFSYKWVKVDGTVEDGA